MEGLKYTNSAYTHTHTHTHTHTVATAIGQLISSYQEIRDIRQHNILSHPPVQYDKLSHVVKSPSTAAPALLEAPKVVKINFGTTLFHRDVLFAVVLM